MTPRKRRTYSHIRGVRLRTCGGITRTHRSHCPYSAGLRLKRDDSAPAGSCEPVRLPGSPCLGGLQRWPGAAPGGGEAWTGTRGEQAPISALQVRCIPRVAQGQDDGLAEAKSGNESAAPPRRRPTSACMRADAFGSGASIECPDSRSSTGRLKGWGRRRASPK